jgi:hypothetical protein
VNWGVCELAIALQLHVVTICKCSINPITNPNQVYSHLHMWQYKCYNKFTVFNNKGYLVWRHCDWSSKLTTILCFMPWLRMHGVSATTSQIRLRSTFRRSDVTYKFFLAWNCSYFFLRVQQMLRCFKSSALLMHKYASHVALPICIQQIIPLLRRPPNYLSL